MPNTVDTMEFHKFYIEKWNSGPNSRNYENYCRDIRLSKGLHNKCVTDEFFAANASEELSGIENFLFKEYGAQCIYSRDTTSWSIIVIRGIPRAIVNLEVRGEVIEIRSEGDHALGKEIVEKIKNNHKSNGVCITELLRFTDVAKTKPSYIFRNDDTKIGKDHYYPWLKKLGMTLPDFINDFMAARAAGLLFIGAPGTGKSTLIRTIFLSAMRDHNYLVTDEILMRHEMFSSWLRSRDNKAMIALEDADNLLRARKDENAMMTALLNLLEGVIPNEMRFMISTNLESLQKVDTALDRKGRIHRVVEFELFTADYANEVREIDGLPRLNISSDLRYSLADTLNAETAEEMQHRSRTGFGFSVR